MVEIGFIQIKNAVREALLAGLCRVEPEMTELLERAGERETSPAARYCLEVIAENNREAEKTRSPACQDTGLVLFFVRLGRETRIEGGLLSDALNAAVGEAYAAGSFRLSVCDPLTREPSGGNTPAVIYTEIAGGGGLTIDWLIKGAGAENMSALKMPYPNEGERGIVDACVAAVKSAGSKPCPPIILGVGVGGTADKALQLSKYALTRETGKPSENAAAAQLEQKIMEAVNGLGIGVQGFGGPNTCLAVHVETYPTHIGMLPVGISVQCHSVRRGRVEFN
ncbi:MAG: fumarate hydratase [Clostridiales bacterium]|jgi:fumarate hydratase subunit alpha|nr:fumarate hydratase [Clostridiales bacterium]